MSEMDHTLPDYTYEIFEESVWEELRECYYDNNPDEDALFIGAIRFSEDDTVEEKVLGKENFQGKVKECIIEFRANEGWEKPHFHIYNKDHSFNCAIRLDCAKYFIHGKYQDTLNKKQAKMFDDFLRLKFRYPDPVTRWKATTDDYYMTFYNKKHIELPDEQPDYTKLSK